MNGSILGASVKRVEDPRFITGGGRYLADVHVDQAVAMVPVRSAVPHGVLVDIDVEEALSHPSVIKVYRAGDLDMAPMPVGAPDVDRAAARPAIATDRVRFVGDIVAVVVAETERAAVDAASLVWADIDPLPVVSTPEQGAAEGAELLFPALGTNVIYDRGKAEPGVLEDAEVTVETVVANQRIAAVPMEPNGALAIPTDEGGIDILLGSQNAHSQRRDLARVLDLDPSLIRVRVPDVGGGFGAKIALYPEQALSAAIALDLQRPVRWLESRTENFLAMHHGRAQTTQIRLGATRDGRLVGATMSVTQDGGAYPLFGSYLPAITRRMAAGPYVIPRVEFRWRSVLTNTTPIHAYRGAGRPEATMALERAMDRLAVELGIDPAELRRRNFIPEEDFPYVTSVRERYDSGNYGAAMKLALQKAAYDEARAEQAKRRESDNHLQLGIGVSSYVEITAPGGRQDFGAVEINEDGTVSLYSSAVSQGHSHETTFAQIVSHILKVPPETIDFIQGDTGLIPHSGGTMGSRSLQIVGSAVFGASKRALHKAREVFAVHSEAALDDVIQYEDGRIGVVGVPTTATTLAEIARLAADPSNLLPEMDPGLRGEEIWEQDEATVPFGTHISIVEVDTETGAVRVLRHIACDDTGTILSPMVVDGQVHGGVAQGIGQALFEEVRYDEYGNPLTGNLTSYLIPSAASMPMVETHNTETPTPENPLGAKGIGEAGTIGSTPAIVNAVIDALSHYGIRHLDMPLTADKVWTAIASASHE